LKYEKPRKPVVIQGLAAKWPAKVNWRLEELHRRFAAERFKIGTDDDGYGVSVLRRVARKKCPVNVNW